MFWEGPPVYEGWGAVDPGTPPAGTEGPLRSAVAEAAEAYGAEAPANVRARVAHGRPAARLVEESDHAHMLVLGRGGHGGMRNPGLGSVSSACVPHARCWSSGADTAPNGPRAP